jgi:hypothetical protein|tara:strand:+ start:291 stop:617 length:327 start_codon:yes stop_codon:yes gene_type:complete
MAQIDIDAAYALMNKIPFKRGNTVVTHTEYPEGTASEMLLHGNLIAWITPRSQQLWISHSGFMTRTTKNRLNALPNVHIVQRNYMWYLNGSYWGGTSQYIGSGIPQVW